uniref:SET domain-containing protein n=1 Tax=Anolis carolinensis TaxID=28377 RepID=A0A803TP42_ANOCA
MPVFRERRGHEDKQGPNFCEECRLYFQESCPQHGPPTFVADSPVPERAPSRALLSLPEGLVVKERLQGGFGVWSTLPTLPRGCIFGPYEGKVAREHSDCTRYSWVRDNGSYFFIDASDDSRSSWMKYVACASTEDEQNLTVFQYRGYIYYRVCQTISADTELLVWIGEEYGRTLGLHLGRHKKGGRCCLSMLASFLACFSTINPLVWAIHRKPPYIRSDNKTFLFPVLCLEQDCEIHQADLVQLLSKF